MSIQKGKSGSFNGDDIDDFFTTLENKLENQVESHYFEKPRRFK